SSQARSARVAKSTSGAFFMDDSSVAEGLVLDDGRNRASHRSLVGELLDAGIEGLRFACVLRPSVEELERKPADVELERLRFDERGNDLLVARRRRVENVLWTFARGNERHLIARSFAPCERLGEKVERERAFIVASAACAALASRRGPVLVIGG